MNPFQHKFTEFTQTLSEKNAQHLKQDVTTKSGDIFQDKPYSVEFKGLYNVARVGQSLTQVVTFLTTAALGVFALSHVVPASWGVYLALPIAILFAFGVEKTKRATMAIAAKYWLKYKQFGGVGFVALLVMCVSIAAALYGAKELPGVMYPVPEKKQDTAAISALTANIEQVQTDIERLQKKQEQAANWVAENKTLPQLQTQRLALIADRTEAQQAADQRADQEHTAAMADRAQKVDKMQTYSIGAAIIAELIFALCTAYIFYYLFRHYAETSADDADATQEQPKKAQTFAVNGFSQHLNNTAAKNENQQRRPIGFTIDENRLTNQSQGNLRTCQHCQTTYQYRHAKQKFCSDSCRIDAWQEKTGKEIKRRNNAVNVP